MADGDTDLSSQQTPLGQQVPLGLSENDYTYAQLVDAHNRAYMGNDQNAVTQLQQMIDNKMRTMRQNAAETGGFGEQFARSYGTVLPRALEGLANWAGLKGTLSIPGPVRSSDFDSTDAGIRNEDFANRALKATPGGMAGDITGQAVNQAALALATRGITLPFAAAELGPVGAQVFVRAAELAKTNPGKAKVLVNALKTAEAGGQGAVQGGAMAAPGEQAEGAKTGAILNTVLGAGMQGGGRVLSGLVERSPAAQAVIAAGKEAGKDIFLPISQAAARSGISGAAKSIYQRVLPYALSVEGRLGGQSEAAKEGVRETVANMQRSLLSDKGEAVPRPELTGTPAEQAQQVNIEHSAALKKNFDDYLFQVPFNFNEQVDRHLLRMHPDMPAELRGNMVDKVMENMKTYAPDGELSGVNLRRVLKSTESDLNGMGNKYEGDWKDSATQPIRDIIDNEMAARRDLLKRSDDPKVTAQASRFLEDMQNYKALAAKDEGVQAIVRATEGAPLTRGAYEFKDAMSGMRPTGEDYKLLQNAHEVLSQSPGYASPLGRHMFHTIGGIGVPGLGFHFGHGEAGLGIPYGFELGANVLSSKPAQRFLYGESAFGAQKALADYLKRSPTGAASAGAAGRGAITADREER